ncbi:MAG: GTP pyrophosphokinase family protein [Lachnospiraceae bacterium]|nr:GTP pyrophosphokinase family protein [Lachnospiraceae bacterium]
MQLSELSTDAALELLRVNTMPYQKLMTYYRCAIMEVETKFKVLNEELSLSYERNPIESIKGRIKTPESIFRKMRQKDIPVSIETVEEHINDIAGIRIICSFIDDIYTIAESFLMQDDVTLIAIKDYIKNPKPGGYRSLHLIISIPIFLQNEKRNMKVEVQLRTIAMDFWASLEHKIRYKKHIPENEAALLARELLECADQSAALDEKMQVIKNRLKHLGETT